VNYLATISFIAPISAYVDFLGINYYVKVHVRAAHPRFSFLTKKKNDVGWSIDQDGLYTAIRQNQIWRKPIYITENGVADGADKHRPRFLKDAFYYLSKAIRKGADVRGYFHWTLMDNFEWASGYTAKFGLFTRDRKPRKSAHFYRDLIDKSTYR
jgi:beta-glucosidase